MDEGLDPPGTQVLPHHVPIGHPDHELVPGRLRRVVAGGKDQRQPRERAEIETGGGGAAGVPGVEVGEPHAEERRLEVVQPAVGADLDDLLAARGAVVAQAANAGDRLRVPGGQAAAVGEGAQVLARVEAPGDGVAEGADPGAVDPRPVSLGRVGQDRHALVPRPGEDRGHVRRTPVEVDRDDRPRARAAGAVEPGGVHRVGRLERLDPDRHGADRGDRQPGHRRRVRGDEHLVALADAQRPQAEGQRVEAAPDPGAMRRAAVGGELPLEGLELLAEEEPATPHHRPVGPVELRRQLLVGGAEVEERDRHAEWGGPASNSPKSVMWSSGS